MAQALQLAERGLWTTTPNPRVGCVLVRQGVVIGEGWHERAGAPHAEALALARAVAELPRLRLRGIMCIPEPASDFVAACAIFARARALFDQMSQAGMPLDTLSMGMSDDLEAAIASGSTLVRVGSAIFGARARAPLTIDCIE